MAASDEFGMNLVVYWYAPELGYATSDFVGRWYDDTGAPVSDPFLIAPGGTYTSKWSARALIGGCAAVQIDGIWVAAIPSDVAAVTSPPQFLADHPGWDFYIVRGRRAYARVSRTNGPGWSAPMPFYSAAGNRCGAVDFPYGNLSVGADGSVIAAGGIGGCTKTWWPALLQ